VVASPILWWAACISIGLGLLFAFWFVLVCAFTYITFRPPSDGVEVDDEAGGMVFIFTAIPVLLIAPAACILVVLWLLNLAPETFDFLGSSPLPPFSLPLPGYYTVGRIVTLITIVILCAGPIWATLATIASLRRRISKNSEN
jgi:hypothetical protein